MTETETLEAPPLPESPVAQIRQGIIEFSENHKDVSEALVEAEKMFPPLITNATNPFYGKDAKYADLAAVLEVVKKPLLEKGILIIQAPSSIEKTEVRYERKDPKNFQSEIVSFPAIYCEVSVETKLLHAKSSQWIRNILTARAVKIEPQGIASAITYLRRYAVLAMTGLAPEDDDGNAASGNSHHQQPWNQESGWRRQQQPPPPSSPPPRQTTTTKPSDAPAAAATIPSSTQQPTSPGTVTPEPRNLHGIVTQNPKGEIMGTGAKKTWWFRLNTATTSSLISTKDAELGERILASYGQTAIANVHTTTRADVFTLDGDKIEFGPSDDGKPTDEDLQQQADDIPFGDEPDDLPFK